MMMPTELWWVQIWWGKQSLLKPEAPLVGTGIESDVALDSGVTIVAKRDGVVDKIDGKRIVIKASSEKDYSKSGVDIYNLQNSKDLIKILA